MLQQRPMDWTHLFDWTLSIEQSNQQSYYSLLYLLRKGRVS